METKAVKKFMEKMDAYYPKFKETIGDGIDEWIEALEPYEEEDIYKNFQKHLNGEYANIPPKLHFLTKYLRTDEEKKEFYEKYQNARCMICGELVKLELFEKHYERCLSVYYLSDMCKKHFGKEIDKKTLYNMSEENFDNYYWQSCEKIYLKMPDCLDKRVLRNALLTHKGEEPQFTIHDLVKESDTK